jgi:KDO2-lipid IV(A) lauroyltransferase
MLWALGAWLGRLAWFASSTYRGKSLAHLRLAGYPLDGPLPGLVRENTGRLIAELPALWFWSDDRLFARCHSASRSLLLAAIDRAKRENRGLLFMTPHLGSFEVIPRYIAQYVPITVLFKPAKHAWLDRLLRVARNRASVDSVPADLSGVRALLRSLKRGEAVGLLPDQVPGQGDGVLAPFFGHQALTMTLPQGLVRRANPIVLMAVAQRCHATAAVGQGGWEIHFEIYEGSPTPQAVNAVMEQWIRRLPEQYLWSYNRYKGTETVK